MSDVTLADRPSRYRQIAEALRGEIAAERWPVGDRLPTEQELCERFGVSRYTVRQALGALVDLGLVGRRQGDGSRVLARQPERPFANSIATIDDLLQYADASRLQVTATGRADLDPPGLLSLSGEDLHGWRRIDGLRFPVGQDVRPFAWTQVMLPPRFAAYARCLGLDRRPLHRVIAEQAGVTVDTVEQTIEAVVLEDDVARALDCPPGTPGLAITRFYMCGPGDYMLIAINLHPGQRFAYRMRLGRSEGRER